MGMSAHNKTSLFTLNGITGVPLVWLMGLIYELFCDPLQTSPYSGFRLGMMYIEK